MAPYLGCTRLAAQTMRSTNVDLGMLGESFKYAAPLAKAAGWSFEETAAAIGFLGNAGIQGSMAGTGLNNMLATLSDTSSTGGKKLKEFGVAAPVKLAQPDPAQRRRQYQGIQVSKGGGG